MSDDQSYLTLGFVTYVTKRMTDDELNNYSERLWLIAKGEPKRQISLHQLTLLSKFWFYRKYYGCQYNAVIHRAMQEAENTLYVDEPDRVHNWII